MNVLITGANRGLGFQLAQRGAERGHVILAGVREASLTTRTEALRELQDQFPGLIHIIPLDVSDETSIQEGVRIASDFCSHLDAVVNNAGILLSRDRKLESLDVHDLEQTFRINLYGPMLVLKHFLPLLSQGSAQTIINVTSESGSYSNAYGGDFPYALSKAALNYFSSQMRNHLRDKDIRVYAVHPGWIKTDMGGDQAPGDPKETADGILGLIERTADVRTDQVFVDFRGQPMPL
jgi:NAD(P)-dependent dehydrogenase (short-subunit alcohol dehydrogenase family)